MKETEEMREGGEEDEDQGGMEFPTLTFGIIAIVFVVVVIVTGCYWWLG